MVCLGIHRGLAGEPQWCAAYACVVVVSAFLGKFVFHYDIPVPFTPFTPLFAFLTMSPLLPSRR